MCAREGWVGVQVGASTTTTAGPADALALVPAQASHTHHNLSPARATRPLGPVAAGGSLPLTRMRARARRARARSARVAHASPGEGRRCRGTRPAESEAAVRGRRGGLIMLAGRVTVVFFQ